MKVGTLFGEAARYVEHLPELVSKGQVSMEEVDEGRVLGVFFGGEKRTWEIGKNNLRLRLLKETQRNNINQY